MRRLDTAVPRIMGIAARAVITGLNKDSFYILGTVYTLRYGWLALQTALFRKG